MVDFLPIASHKLQIARLGVSFLKTNTCDIRYHLKGSFNFCLSGNCWSQNQISYHSVIKYLVLFEGQQPTQFISDDVRGGGIRPQSLYSISVLLQD